MTDSGLAGNFSKRNAFRICLAIILRILCTIDQGRIQSVFGRSGENPVV